MRKNKTQKKILAMLIIIIALSSITPFHTAVAAETATIRVISTTDLHGQLANTNYDTAGAKVIGSLAQDYTLIKEARSEIKYGTSITVDIGDTIYGYGSDYVYKNDGNEYMYSAIAKMGYDAITLGNHDFDYGYQYVEKQLKKAGLDDICVVSNVYDAVTGKNVWNENKILTKTVTTSKGKKITVKIGMIGVTLPSLTTYYNHTGLLTTKDIVESTKEQVTKLKKQGADLIVVMAHSGIGTEDPEKNSSDASYAISKIDGVDAVMCGHSHLNYPSSSAKAQNYYQLPNVNKTTGLMNGKPVVMVADHGAGIGIADLKLQISNGKITLVGQKASIKYATKDTISDPVVMKFQKVYDKLIKQTYSEVVGELLNGTNITNYFGLLEDNAAIQLVNEAKIKVGLNYINTKNTAYKDCPVVAVSTYKKYGTEKDDYININGVVTMGDVLSIQSYYHDFSYIYWITGKQLREWLEWTASAYETPGSMAKSGDDIMDSYISDMGMNSLIKKDWLANWSNFYMFDGVEYDIDITEPAKYSASGTIINGTASRIKKLTYDGKEVTDDTKLILVSDIVTAGKAVVGPSLAKQRLYKSAEYSANLLKEYIKDLNQFGKIAVDADKNWRIIAPNEENCIIRSSVLSEDVAKNQGWYQETLNISENYAYYKGNFPANYTDMSAPTLVITPTITVKTNKDIPIIVQATDASSVSNVRYAAGLFEADDSVWSTGVSSNIVNGIFYATQNGTYTVWAIDGSGNKAVKHVKVTNINRDVLQVPTVNKVTNKSKIVTGAGEPGATITIKANGSTYTTQVTQEGTFECKIPFQNADKKIKVSQTEPMGKTSDYVSVPVMRAGPNYPILTTVNNKKTAITMDINDVNSQIFAFINDKVYVAEYGGKKAYMSTSKYDPDYTIVETKYTRSGNMVSLTIPVQYAGTEISICAVDHIGRINYPINTKVKEVAPEMPVLYNTCDGEHYVYGYIPESEEIPYDISVTVGNDTYAGTSNTEGYFKIGVDKLVEGQTVFVTASDVVNDKTRVSAKGSKVVRSYTNYVLEDSKATIFLQPMTDKDTIIKGTVTDFTGTLYIKAGSRYYDIIMEEGVNTFEIPLETALDGGDTVAVVLRKEFSNIKEVAGITVSMSSPEMPTLINKAIYTTTKTVKIESTEKCAAHVKIGKTIYTAQEGILDETTGLYTYEVKIEKSKVDQTVYVYMENEAGKSERIKLIVTEKEKEV